MKENRFYVFTGAFWPDFLHRSLDPILAAQNPPVVTWGPDLRPDSAKSAAS